MSASGRLTGNDFARILPFGAEVRTAAPARPSSIMVPYAQAEAEFEKADARMRAAGRQRADFGSRQAAAHLARDVLQEARKIRAGTVRLVVGLIFETTRVSNLG
jgi:hypothetical protein